MVIKMKMKVYLPRVRSDRGSYSEETSSFLLKTNRRVLNNRSTDYTRNKWGEVEYKTNSNVKTARKFHENPYWQKLSAHMYNQFVANDAYASSNEMSWITFRYYNGDSSLMIRKDGSTFFMNGIKQHQKDVAIALGKIIAFGAQNRCKEAMDAYIERNCTYPSNVLYAVENRAPYKFFVDSQEYKVRINTELIGRDEVAFEISENIWGSLSVKEANTFINAYKNESKVSRKWADISPSNLWYNMFETHVTDAQEQLMRSWLLQNRTSVIVEERAFELLQDMDRNYDEFTLVDMRKAPFSNLGIDDRSRKHHFAMHVTGEISDWIVYPNDSTGSQRCKVRLIQIPEEGDIRAGSPFCIDDINSKNVMGDQVATRAMLLKNDRTAAKMVSTLRDIEKTATKSRINRKVIEKARFTEELRWN